MVIASGWRPLSRFFAAELDTFTVLAQNLRTPEMNKHEKRTPEIEGGAVGQGNEAARQLDRIRPLVNQLRADLRTRQLPQGLTPEQRAALERAEEAIETYVSFFYAPASRP